jgi:hypothetical protein
MTPHQAALLDNHRDLAQLSCTGQRNVFWVLDLTDPKAFRLAEEFQPKASLLQSKEKELSQGNIPAITVSSDIKFLNAYRTQIMGMEPIPHPPDHLLYIIICSEERILIAASEKMNVAKST